MKLNCLFQEKKPIQDLVLIILKIAQLFQNNSHNGTEDYNNKSFSVLNPFLRQ